MTEIDFSRAEYTAVISDLHLCEAEPVDLQFPLWKKYKTKAFFFDSVFGDFLDFLEKESRGGPIELVLNGDIFDFDSVLSLPPDPIFRISWLEKKRGLDPRPERSRYKVQVILNDHDEFFDHLRRFIQRGHRVVFIIGNHDLELNFPSVQEEILKFLALSERDQGRVRIVDLFYISNGDTLIEHGHQYDPYCACDDPINPFSQGYNYKTIRLPFGNLACRYLVNGMGFFNPHVDSNYIMGLSEYIRFFFKYMVRAQPNLVFTWFFGSLITLWKSFGNRLDRPIRDPMKIEDRVEQIAQRANASPRMVRELKELFVASATENPLLVAQELWLDRALIICFFVFVMVELLLLINQFFGLQGFEVWFFGLLVPLFLLVPFFLFYSRSIVSRVSTYKEPDEQILLIAGVITKTNRIVYGHTHHARHEMIGPIEHLNSGTWSPAFLDVECQKAIDNKTFIWITPDQEGPRKAQLMRFKAGNAIEVTSKRSHQ